MPEKKSHQELRVGLSRPKEREAKNVGKELGGLIRKAIESKVVSLDQVRDVVAEALRQASSAQVYTSVVPGWREFRGAGRAMECFALGIAEEVASGNPEVAEALIYPYAETFEDALEEVRRFRSGEAFEIGASDPFVLRATELKRRTQK